jgi:hypothetical protein
VAINSTDRLIEFPSSSSFFLSFFFLGIILHGERREIEMMIKLRLRDEKIVVPVPNVLICWPCLITFILTAF